jgi:hypothetical protein
MDIALVMRATVGLTVNKLSDDECVAIFLSSQMGEISPSVMGYEKLEPLFTEGHGQMHNATKEALLECLNSRISKITG